jgi:hypothetical protein
MCALIVVLLFFLKILSTDCPSFIFIILTFIRMTEDEKGLAFFKGLLL